MASPPEATTGVDIKEFERFFLQVEDALASDAPRLRRQADELLSSYHGIPAPVDIFGILDLHGAEDPHTNFLSWLLDPEESHGAGEAFLRRFLALVDHDDALRLVASPRPLRASVQTQYPLAKYCQPDLVFVVRESDDRGVVFILEAKIKAGLTMGKRPTSAGDDVKDEDQTKRYAEVVQDFGLHTRVPTVGGRAIDHRNRRHRCVFVFLEATPVDGVDARYHHVTYAEVERELAALVDEVELRPEVYNIVQQFRTSLLVSALPDESGLAALRELRRARLLGDRVGRLPEALALSRLVDGFSLGRGRTAGGQMADNLHGEQDTTND